MSERSVVSGPPLSVGRLRQNSVRDPRMSWRGVGLTACVGAFGFDMGAARPGLKSGVATPRLLQAAPQESDTSGINAAARRTVAGFFALGGREIVVLDEARFAEPGRWVGEDGGPGNRTGIFQLLDLQEVTTILFLGMPFLGGAEEDRRAPLLDLARRRPDKFFLLPTGSGRQERDAWQAEGSDNERRPPEARLTFLLPNAAAVHPTPAATGGAGDASRDAGRLAALLDATDFADQPRFRRPAASSFGLGPRGGANSPWRRRSAAVLRLMAWRRWEGLRRSIELGTRWAVLELHHPFVWRHVERDILGFLYRMAEYGLIRRPGAGGFQVRCTPRPEREAASGVPSSAPSSEGTLAAVDVRVAARLRAPYDAARDAAGFELGSSREVGRAGREEQT